LIVDCDLFVKLIFGILKLTHLSLVLLSALIDVNDIHLELFELVPDKISLIRQLLNLLICLLQLVFHESAGFCEVANLCLKTFSSVCL
jgi:hypothetical protein